MMSEVSIRLEPRFLGKAGARWFTLKFCAATEAGPKGQILFIPPFAEEMNRCRSLVATQARAFAQQGYDCTVLDFYGTGESEGLLTDACLDIWRENVRETVTALQKDSSQPLYLWGLRLGGLLALHFASDAFIAATGVILWQPVTSGKMYVNQILRQRVAALMVRELPAETTKEIRQRLAQGEQVEVAGYTLDGRLIGEIEVLEIAQMQSLGEVDVFWLEHVTEDGKEIGVPARKAVNALSVAARSVVLHTFSDPPIWLIHERDFAPQLLRATEALLP